jgi:deazaflavin-dependent oxidoreductase (nitroreductase family)
VTNAESSGGRYAKRIAVPDEARSRSTLKHVDYQDTFVIGAEGADSDNAEQWARNVFESAPAAVRLLIRLGWRSYGARLGPFPSPGHVAGWTIGQSEPDWIRLELAWAIGLRMQLVLRRRPSAVTMSTFVEHDRRVARMAWPTMVPVHWLIVRSLLRRAAKAHARERAFVVRPFVIWYQRNLANPLARRLSRFIPGSAVVETVGRHSGLPRRTPVGGRVEGSTFWLVSEFGRHSHYVRNIDANPNVRVQFKGRWHTGKATLVEDDNPRERLRRLPKMNSFLVRMVGTDLMTVRIDLEAPPG